MIFQSFERGGALVSVPLAPMFISCGRSEKVAKGTFPCVADSATASKKGWTIRTDHRPLIPTPRAPQCRLVRRGANTSL